jgi:hypothetical protein
VYGPLVSVEIVVWRLERRCDVDLQQRLSSRIGFLDKPDVHPSDAIPSLGEGGGELGDLHQLVSRSLLAVRGLRESRGLSGEPKCKCSLAMRAAGVCPKAVPDSIRTAGVQMSPFFREQVYTSLRDALGQLAQLHWRHCQQLLQQWLKCRDVISEDFVHRNVSVPPEPVGG